MDESFSAFEYYWRLENFCFCDFDCTRSLHSPPFILNAPISCKWSLYMFPNGLGIDKYVGIYLKRSKKDPGPKEISVRFKISLIDVDLYICPETAPIEKVFTKGCEWGHNEFIKRSEIITGSRFLHRDTLIVLCQITVIGPNLLEGLPRHELSPQPGEDEEIKSVFKAIKLMYKDNIQCDITLEGISNTFNSHKCMIRTRLPGLFKKLDSMPQSAIKDDFIMEKFLSYAYCGKLNINDCDPCTIKKTLAEYGLLHLEKDLISHNYCCHALTYFPIKKCGYHWELLISLFREEKEIFSPFISDGSQKSGFFAHLCKTEDGIWKINIKALTSNHDDIFVRCDISVRNTSLSNRSTSDVCEHVFRSNNWWEYPTSIQVDNDSVTFNNGSYNLINGFFFIDFMFTYSSGKVQSNLEQMSSSHTSFTHCGIDHSKKLLVDLETLFCNPHDSDATILAGNRQFRVHKCILCARSPYFTAMFTHEMVEKKENLVHLKSEDLEDPIFAEVVDKLLLFTYCGKFEARSPTFAGLLSKAIEMYMIGEDYENM